MSEASEEATTSKPDYVTVEIPSTPTAAEEPKAVAAEDSSIETTAANVALLAAAVQNSNQQQPPTTTTTTTPKAPATPKTPNTPSRRSRLRKRFSVTGSGVTSAYPYPLGLDPDENKPGPTTTTVGNGLTFWKFFNLIELALAVVFLGLLVANLTVDSWKHNSIWELRNWKWCLLLFVILGGRLASELVVNAAIFLVNGCVDLITKWSKDDVTVWTFTQREKFKHISLGLRTSFQVLVWFASVLLAWGLLLGRTGDIRTRHTRKLLDHVTRALAGCLIGAGIWWAKSLLIELAAYDFIVERSRQRIVDSIIDQEALKSVWDNTAPLAGSPGREEEGKVEKVTNDFMLTEKVRAWTPPKLVSTLTRAELTVVVDGELRNGSPETVSRATANELFARIAGSYDAKYVDTDKVLASLKEGYKKRIPVGVEEGGVGQISRSYFRNWVIKIYLDRLLLLRTLNGRDNVVGDLNKIVSAIALVIILVVWLLVMGFLTTNVMLLIATQIVALNFMFNNTAKTIFESVIFVFVVRPFDVGDLCSIDDKEEQVIVQDMNILSTIFKKSNGQTLFYPNGVLLTKYITNYCGVPATNDSVEFIISARTEPDTIKQFKSRIEEYLKSRPKHWRSSDFSVSVDEVDEKDMNVGIYVDHVVNFYNGGDRKKHRQELLDEVIDAIDDLKIECHSDPQ